MITSPVINVVLFIALALFCGTATLARADETRLAAVLSDGGEAAITFAASPLKAMQEIPFTITLHTASGEMIKDAELGLSLTMPFMPMPPNTPQAAWRKDAYRGVAIFTMAGAWQVNVAVNRPGTEVEQIVFDIEMVIM